MVIPSAVAVAFGLAIAADAAPTSSLASFTEAAEAYAKLHREAAGELAGLPKKAEAGQIAAHQKELATRIVAARRRAGPGDVFVVAARPALRQMLREALSQQPAAKEKEIATGNPVHEGVSVPLRVNSRYPDGAPRSNVPTTVLARLPKLPRELEYRFVGDHLVLLDVDAQVIVDFMARSGDPAPPRVRP
jgi:hypothetical protein